MIRVVRNLLLARPILAVFDVTRRCNQRCAFCSIPRSDSRDMDLGGIRDTAERLRRFGIGYVFIQGGEPTLRADLVEIVDVFIANGIKPTVITNGILLTEPLARELAARRCNVAVSLDTLDRGAYERIRGVDRLDAVVANVRAAASLPQRRGNWALTTTVTALTKSSDIAALEAFACECGFMYAIRPYVVVKGTAGRRDEDLAYDGAGKSQVIEVFARALTRAYQDNYLAALVYEEHLAYLRGTPMPPCDAMRYSLLVREDGRVAPCIELPDESVDLGEFAREQRRLAEVRRACNCDSPCFYNDAREIGILWRKKWRVLAHLPRVVAQMRRYGNFF